MKKIKGFLFALFVSLIMLFAACDPTYDNGESAATDTVNVTPVEIVIDQAEEADTLVQCYAITKAGTRCERMVNAPDTLCFQHKK